MRRVKSEVEESKASRTSYIRLAWNLLSECCPEQLYDCDHWTHRGMFCPSKCFYRVESTNQKPALCECELLPQTWDRALKSWISHTWHNARCSTLTAPATISSMDYLECSSLLRRKASCSAQVMKKSVHKPQLYGGESDLGSWLVDQTARQFSSTAVAFTAFYIQRQCVRGAPIYRTTILISKRCID